MGNDGQILDQLLCAIRSAAGDSEIGWAEPPITLEGGFWAQVLKVRLSGTTGPLAEPLVARIMPDPESGAWETKVQSYLADQGFATPHVRLSGAPDSVIGSAWMLMDFAEGQPLLDGLSGSSAIAKLPRLIQTVPNGIGLRAAQLHAIDAKPLDDGTDMAGEYTKEMAEIAIRIGRPDLARAAEWLTANRPPSSQLVLCHGDLHPFNILAGPEGATVLDWTTAMIADPAYEISYSSMVLEHPPLEGPVILGPIVSAGGRFLASRFRASYRRHSDAPIDPSQIEWFTNYHALRIAIEVAGWEPAGEVENNLGHPFISLTDRLSGRVKTMAAPV